MSFEKDSKGRLFVTPWPTEGSRKTVISHRWNDPTTWAENAVKHVDQLATGGAASVYQLPHTNIINCKHGKLWAEEQIADEKHIKVEADNGAGWIELTEEDFHTGNGDYTVNYEAGTINYNAGTNVRATYYAAGSSLFTIKPTAGKALLIKSAEVQFAADTEMSDTVIFETFGYVDVFAPQYLDTADPPGPHPSGTLIPINKTMYKTLHQFVDESNGSNPTIPAIGGAKRGISSPITVFPWEYAAALPISSAAGMEVRVYLEHDAPFGGSYATATFYCLSENE